MADGRRTKLGWISLFLLIHIKCDGLSDVWFEAECTEHHLVITVPFTGNTVPHFKAKGVFPISKNDGGQCGYAFNVYQTLKIAVLRASYFSCHADNKDDMTFTFNFHLFTSDNGDNVEILHNITRSCSLSRPWAHREIVCEENYLQVSVKNSLPGPCKQSSQDVEPSSASSVVHEAIAPGWQLMFLRHGKALEVLSVQEAEESGYYFSVTPGRVVFRAPYGQEHSSIEMVSGLAVEEIHLALMLQQTLTTVMVDLVAACSLNNGSIEDGNFVWSTPTVMAALVSKHSGYQSQQLGVGVGGKRLNSQVAAERGYVVAVGPEVVKVSIPYTAEGGIKRSFVKDNVLHESYAVSLYYEHVFMTDDALENRLSQMRMMTSPIVLRNPFIINQTVVEEQLFTVYVGNFPSQVELIGMSLNGKSITVVPDTDQNKYQLTLKENGNDTHGYIVRVPFKDPLVSKMYYMEGIQEYLLTINYTFSVVPSHEEYFYIGTVTAQIGVKPPQFTATCLEGGIRFQVEHPKFNHLWEPGIGSLPLTEELAKTRGYSFQNDSQGLMVDIPLFTPGYIYEEICLAQFSATFEVLIRETGSLDIVQFFPKTCVFNTTELQVCSPEGFMTVVSDLRKVTPRPSPSTTTLLDKTCKPKQADENRALYEFALNSCGTKVQVTEDFVIYDNEITFDPSSAKKRQVITRDTPFRIMLRCTYPVKGVSRLFVDRKFQSESPGIGSVKIQPINGSSKSKPTRSPPAKKPSKSIHRPVKYIRVFSWGIGGDRKMAVQPSDKK